MVNSSNKSKKNNSDFWGLMEVVCGVLVGTALLKTLFKLLPDSQPCPKCHHLIEPVINQCPNCKVNIVWKNIKKQN